jgi:tetratricopeptide (TPR) repeat protein
MYRHILSYAAILCAAILLTTDSAISQKKDTTSMADKIARLDQSVSEIRRDQLNYSIERDLLKEAFSSNYQTINIVLAIILGVFTVVGFLGIRDISNTRAQYLDELNKLNDLRKDFEIKISKYQSEQDKVKEDYFAVLKTNEEQTRRIKVLELQEKVSTLMQQTNYQRALEYVFPALEMDPENQLLLRQKGMCLWRLSDLTGAITSFAKAVQLDPSDLAAVMNLSELFLITNRIDEFQALYAKNKMEIAKTQGPALTAYFEILVAYQSNDLGGMRNLMRDYFTSLQTDKELRASWDFADATKALSPKSDEPRGGLLIAFIDVVKGTKDRKEAMALIAESK